MWDYESFISFYSSLISFIIRKPIIISITNTVITNTNLSLLIHGMGAALPDLETLLALHILIQLPGAQPKKMKSHTEGNFFFL